MEAFAGPNTVSRVGAPRGAMWDIGQAAGRIREAVLGLLRPGSFAPWRRPAISLESRCLIRRMWRANPTWGSPRIVAELQKLGIDIAKSTVEKYRPKSHQPTSPSWCALLKQQLRDTVAIDFFTVPTVRSRVLFVLDFLAHDRRRLLHLLACEPWRMPEPPLKILIARTRSALAAIGSSDL